MNTRPDIGLVLVCVALLATSLPAHAQEPVWYPPTEPSPFLPDDARWLTPPRELGAGAGATVAFRGTWQMRGPVRRAVLMAAPGQYVEVYLNGRLVLTGYDHLECLPVWAEVTDRVGPGQLSVAARAYSEWGPKLYAQMRVEYADGGFEDLITGDGWECRAAPPDGWTADWATTGDWSPVAIAGGYYREPGEGIWGSEFALLPRDMLRERLEEHNERLRNLWAREREDGRLVITDAPEEPLWADQFADFCRLDEDTGQLLDGSGRIRHLFLTVYCQRRGGEWVLSLPDMDFDQLERDLDLMAASDVHIYMRFTGWNWLLTKDGGWAELERQPSGTGLPHFATGRELLEHFVRRAYAHGRYIIFEGDFYWGAHADVVPPPYRSRYHIYPEVLEAEALAMRRIMHHLSGCTNVLGMMIGEEDIVLAHDLANPHQHALFADWLRERYGTLDAFRDATPWGYDYGDTSGFRPQRRAPDLWPGQPDQEVLLPLFAAREAPFARVADWLDVPLPLWPGFRSPADAELTLAAFKSYNEFTPEDPLWIDFYEMREDELLFSMLTRWVEIVREGMPRQLLFYSNAQDFTNSWHFLHLYRRADLPFDVIGVGCHDHGENLYELPPASTVRKAIKVVSSYRPYALCQGSPARGIASGEGEGGRPEHPEEVRKYYAGALFDEVGGGAAWTQTYTWTQVSGAEGGEPPHETPLLAWFRDFMPAVQGVAFPLRRPVEVLVVRNANLQHSNMSGLDYGNAMNVAEALTQLNVEFDIVMDRDLAAGEEPLKVNLDQYRLVILPSVAIDHPDGVWRCLDEWLRRGERVLAVGRVGNRGPRLQPRTSFHPVLAQWLGTDAYTGYANLQGRHTVRLEGALPAELTVDFGRVPPTGILDVGMPLLRTQAGDAIAAVQPYGTSTVVGFGFPMGFAYDYLWGSLTLQQNPRESLAPLYEWLLARAGVARPVLAPYNLRVYLAERGEMLLVRERAGVATDAEVALRIPAGTAYAGLALHHGEDGYARTRIAMDAWDSRWWKAVR